MMPSAQTYTKIVHTNVRRNIHERAHTHTRAPTHTHTQMDTSGRAHMQTVCIQRKPAEFSGGANRLSARVGYVNYNFLQSARGFGLRG